jgi:hypothetical protein
MWKSKNSGFVRKFRGKPIRISWLRNVEKIMFHIELPEFGDKLPSGYLT